MKEHKNRNKLLAFALCTAMAASLIGCGAQQNTSTATSAPSGTDASKTTAEGPVTIVALAKSIATNNWQLFGEGCKAAAAELGSDKVTFTFDGASASTELEEQLNLIENYLATGCQAIVVATDAAGAGPILTEAQQNGTIVVLADNFLSGYDDYDNITTYDNKMSGELAAEAMVDALNEEGIAYEGKKIIVISPAPGVSVLEDRDTGFREKMAELAPGIEIVDTQYCDGDNAVALSNAQDAWQAYGEEIVGMYGLDEGVCDAMSRCKDENNLQGKFVIVGVDATEVSIADVEKGNVAAVIGMSMYQEGYACVMNAYAAATGGEFSREDYLTPTVVTLDNYMDEGIRNIWDASVLGQ